VFICLRAPERLHYVALQSRGKNPVLLDACDNFFKGSLEFRMAIERTLSIIKPDAVSKNLIGQIYTRLEKAGLTIIAARMLQLTGRQAQEFYRVHRDRPFYNDLVEFMTSGPIMVQVLQGENAIGRNREIMGATNPREAAAGTIRADFAENVERNAVHGSDGPDTARTEITFFFSDDQIFPRKS
jgi:nucleoside-diphosphate kinase